eukprot:gene516-283_t
MAQEFSCMDWISWMGEDPMGQDRLAAMLGIVSALPRIDRVPENARRRLAKALATNTVNCALSYII